MPNMSEFTFRAFKTNIAEKDLDPMLAEAFIADPKTRIWAIELALGRKVTFAELAKGPINDILVVCLKEFDRPGIAVESLLKLKRAEALRRLLSSHKVTQYGQG